MADEYLYGHLVQEYYVARVRALYERRAKERARVRTKAQVMKLREEARRKLRRCFGAPPARCPLNAQVTGVVERDDYRIEKVIYESRPGLPVTANLYVPNRGSGPRPGVLGACGHSGDGKAEGLYQAFAQNLARQGYVVLIYDPLSQGERLQYPGNEGAAHPQGCCQEHNMMGNQMSLLGEFFGLWRAWDGIRGLDYLLSRPEVDASRVGVTGNSGGGTLTTYLTALDDRFTMAAPSCFVTSYLSDLENELPADSEQIPPGIVGAGLDMADFFIAQIPRPTLLCGQKNDYFDVRGLTATYEELRRLYAILGREEDVQLHVGPTGHGFSVHNREAMYKFFNRHAGVKARAKEQGGERPEKEGVLWATPEGQVHKLGVRRVFDFTRERAWAACQKRERPSKAALVRQLTRYLALPARKEAPHFRILRLRSVGERPGWLQSGFAVETEPGMQAILHVFGEGEDFYHFPRVKEATLFVPHVSSQQDFAAGLAPDAPLLFAVDVRGMGQTMARTCGDSVFFTPYGSDYFYASQGHMLGESYCGRRVHDLLSVLDLMQAQGVGRVRLVGRGLGAVIATLAAPLHPAVKTLTVHNGLLSFHELTQAPVQSWPFSSMVFGMLKTLDLPDCLRAMGRGKVSIVDPWDSQMRSWAAGALKSHLAALGIDEKIAVVGRRGEKA